MRIDPICTAIRFAPVLVLLNVHCSGGRWPTDADCAERVMRYGFSVDLFSEQPARVFTHLFVHISSTHLLSNVFSFAATLVEFGNMTDPAAPSAAARLSDTSHDGEGRGATSGAAASFATQRMALEMCAIWGEQSRLQACARSAGAFLVWAVGGAVGGLGCQMLYNSFALALRRERAARAAAAAAAVANTKHSAAPGSAGERILDSIGRGVKTLWQRAEVYSSNFAVSAQEVVNNEMLMCGASAGICALSGFSAVCYGRPITAFCLAVPEALLLTADIIHLYVAQLAPERGAPNSVAEAARRALQSVWRVRMPGQTVGHAAHVGGFVVGVGMGYCWLWLQRKWRRWRLHRMDSRRCAAQLLLRPVLHTCVHRRSGL
ncbi:putative serine peptidase, Clan S-, family S54 [Leishmania braziliensis MHOM/BR/75/M2904]|uniref:Serine peptidase, Clan S-, family S54 n=2 Tax=Leishmania braziliensis TaxID=5660 RepID=A4H3C4_LEIBR|nr:putative serine peptidase, Clan S-, family S54 [Leishmania braziliensis MHOM/BR/75/M2904]KAI5684830.1 hypothetical protein MNV84_00250 [Leishmania braziliensis]CAJ2465754.1 unnamed protein product [Leishmania braziliensis]CAJ2466312.1 unnamed protein product [Leishmania braziliensis]CAM41430.1 putative serine peptidase, Clan S-, family S54 [Leishmania braziliensis MHOM/BR/75/M2904]SYZ62421.1 serine_peptidase [Leishmania braziliensis MHOM/BR/75/M2904]